MSGFDLNLPSHENENANANPSDGSQAREGRCQVCNSVCCDNNDLFEHLLTHLGFIQRPNPRREMIRSGLQKLREQAALKQQQQQSAVVDNSHIPSSSSSQAPPRETNQQSAVVDNSHIPSSSYSQGPPRETNELKISTAPIPPAPVWSVSSKGKNKLVPEPPDLPDKVVESPPARTVRRFTRHFLDQLEGATSDVDVDVDVDVDMDMVAGKHPEVDLTLRLGNGRGNN